MEHKPQQPNQKMRSGHSTTRRVNPRKWLIWYLILLIIILIMMWKMPAIINRWMAVNNWVGTLHISNPSEKINCAIKDSLSCFAPTATHYSFPVVDETPMKNVIYLLSFSVFGSSEDFNPTSDARGGLC